MTQGLDTNTPVTAHIQAIKAAGYAFIARYYKVTPGSHPLTKAEALALSKAGLYVVVVWENGYPTEVDYFSREKGVEDGRHALECASRVGQPAGTPIYFAVDTDIPDEDMPRITAYFEGVRSIINGHYLIGVYGSGNVCAAIKGAGLAHFAWLAMARGWAGSKTYKEYDLLQTNSGTVCGLDVDYDTSSGHAGGWQIT